MPCRRRPRQFHALFAAAPTEAPLLGLFEPCHMQYEHDRAQDRGGNASRLYRGLAKGRELTLDMELLYGLTSPWEYNGPTLFTRFALYKPDTDAVLKAIDEEIAKITAEGVSEAELARVKTRLPADWYNGLETVLSRADTLARLQAPWGDAEVVNRISKKIQAVSSVDLQPAARRYLDPDGYSIVVVGDAAAIREQLAPYGQFVAPAETPAPSN